MEVNPCEAAGSLVHGGRTYYFCSTHCLEKFRSAGEKYAIKSAEEPVAAATSASIHMSNASRSAERQTRGLPQMRHGLGAGRRHGGRRGLIGTARHDPWFWVSLTLTVPVFAMAMLHVDGLGWLQFALSAPVVLWGGWPFFQRGWASIIQRSLNMFTLIAIGTGVAWMYSVVAVAYGGRVYFESATVIVTLVLLGQVLELRSRRRTSGAIRALLGLAPKTARLIRKNGTELDVPLENVQKGTGSACDREKGFRWMA